MFAEEFQKSQCLYHPTEYITNFCKEKSCLMPLCPTCICSHLQLHIKGGKSTPQFDNINDSYSACSKEIKAFSEKFEQGRTQLNSIERTIVEQKKELSDLIYKTKVQVRDLVEATFDQLQKDLQSAIDLQNRALGLHLPENLDTLQKGIIQIGSKLRQMNGDLKSDRSLSTLITFNHQTRASLQKYQNDVFKQIKNNQQYSPLTTINSEALNKLKQAVTQTISLKFNFPNALKQQHAKNQHTPQSHQSHQTHQTHQTQHGSNTNQQHIHTHHPKQSGIFPSHSQGQIHGATTSSSLGTHPSGIIQTQKNPHTSHISGSVKVGDIPKNTVGQSINNGPIGISTGVMSSNLQNKHKRSEIKSVGRNQNI